MSLAAYLAKNYLTAEEPSKRKKKKQKSSNLDIIDDTATSLPILRNRDEDEDDFADAQVVGDIIVDKQVVPREKRWKPAVKVEEDRPDEQPTISMEDAETQEALVMGSGARAGLQSAAEITAAIERKRKHEMEGFKKSWLSGKEKETIYRDATGRRIDPMLRKAEIRYQQEQREREEREKKEDEERTQRELRGGLAQQRQREEAREVLRHQGTQAFANTREDEEYNESLKAQERWNDPAATFLSKKPHKEKGKRLKRIVPVYMGSAPPNRFRIRPGYRWDGVCFPMRRLAYLQVDRSNGFERLWFSKQNEKKARQDEWDRLEAGADD